MISILTVHGEWSPYAPLQTLNLERHTHLPYEHLQTQGEGTGSKAHGEGLDRLLPDAVGEFVVTLDSDAFPIAPWTHLLDHLNMFEAVAIQHPKRNYPHPSFLAARRDTLQGQTFKRQGRKDVGESLTLSPVRFLTLTGQYAANPIPGEPPLGGVYEDCIYHGWYATRQKLEGNPDGIPGGLIEGAYDTAVTRWG